MTDMNDTRNDTKREERRERTCRVNASVYAAAAWVSQALAVLCGIAAAVGVTLDLLPLIVFPCALGAVFVIWQARMEHAAAYWRREIEIRNARGVETRRRGGQGAGR